MRKEAFRDYLFRAVEDVGAALEPDDDWTPILLMLSETELMVAPLMDDEGQDLTRDLPALTSLISKVRPAMVGRVGMGWASNDMKDSRPVSQREERQEVLIIQIVEPGARQEVWISEVIRHDDAPPEIKEWEKSDSTGGMMVEVIQAAVEHAHRAN